LILARENRLVNDASRRAGAVAAIVLQKAFWTGVRESWKTFIGLYTTISCGYYFLLIWFISFDNAEDKARKKSKYLFADTISMI